MISIIIASVNEKQLADIKQNVAETIGVEYEILSFRNADGKKGLCEIYNQGTKLAKYNLLCFMHEDIDIRTNNWGRIVQDIFDKNNQMGALGVAGSTYKALSPSGWHCISERVERSNILQRFKFSDHETLRHVKNPNSEILSEVACLDGVWFCTTKEIAKEFSFDEDTFNGFHCYDIDFSLQVGQKYIVAVTYNILLEHFSEGKFNKTWMYETFKLTNKWKNKLPINVQQFNFAEIKQVEKRTYKDFIDNAIAVKMPLNTVFYHLWTNNFLGKGLTGILLKVNIYFIKRIFKKSKFS